LELARELQQAINEGTLDQYANEFFANQEEQVEREKEFRD
jgi:queuine/archaeosine tRNA-ribosyltransferase